MSRNDGRMQIPSAKANAVVNLPHAIPRKSQPLKSQNRKTLSGRNQIYHSGFHPLGAFTARDDGSTYGFSVVILTLESSPMAS